LKLARPERPAVCVTSDGSFMMFPGSVATAVEHDIPAIWVIMNNYTIGVIRDLQRFYMDSREIGTSFIKQSTGEFWNPDFAAMAAAMGAGSVSVDQPGEAELAQLLDDYCADLAAPAAARWQSRARFAAAASVAPWMRSRLPAPARWRVEQADCAAFPRIVARPIG